MIRNDWNKTTATKVGYLGWIMLALAIAGGANIWLWTNVGSSVLMNFKKEASASSLDLKPL